MHILNYYQWFLYRKCDAPPYLGTVSQSRYFFGGEGFPKKKFVGQKSVLMLNKIVGHKDVVQKEYVEVDGFVPSLIFLFDEGWAELKYQFQPYSFFKLNTFNWSVCDIVPHFQYSLLWYQGANQIITKQILENQVWIKFNLRKQCKLQKSCFF